ncbi:MAG: hypothetical protein IPN44_08840 [Flavobacteriales bacterium]|nr:hypothetical protein [Flavobacteriales bacterium]
MECHFPHGRSGIKIGRRVSTFIVVEIYQTKEQPGKILGPKFPHVISVFGSRSQFQILLPAEVHIGDENIREGEEIFPVGNIHLPEVRNEDQWMTHQSSVVQPS